MREQSGGVGKSVRRTDLVNPRALGFENNVPTMFGNVSSSWANPQGSQQQGTGTFGTPGAFGATNTTNGKSLLALSHCSSLCCEF